MAELDKARALLDLCRARKLTIATAESCTGGLVAATLTEIPGSSDVFERGFVTYSDAAKAAMLGVPTSVLERFGAVSRETAEAMAQGALAHSPADLAVSITGIAGPGGGSPGKPVGLVHFAAAAHGGDVARACRANAVMLDRFTPKARSYSLRSLAYGELAPTDGVCCE
jgi:nicotinamide-nucleotide amidase